MQAKIIILISFLALISTKIFAASNEWQHSNNNFATFLTPANSSWVYALNASGQIFKSKDNCNSWESADAGLETVSVASWIGDQKGTLYISTTRGIFQLNKGAKRWQALPLTGPYKNTAGVVLVDSQENLYLINGPLILKLAAGKNTWILLKKINHAALTPAVIDGQDNLYVAYSDNAIHELGVWKLTPKTNAWIKINRGFGPEASVISGLGVDAQNNLYANTDGGIFKLSQHQNHWTPGSAGMKLTFNPFGPFLFDPQAKTLYFSTREGIYKLPPGNTTWVLADDAQGFLPFADKYGTGTALSISAMAIGNEGKFCIESNWGMYIQK